MKDKDTKSSCLRLYAMVDRLQFAKTLGFELALLIAVFFITFFSAARAAMTEEVYEGKILLRA